MKNHQLTIFKLFNFVLLFAFFIALQSCNKEDPSATNSDYQGKSTQQNIITVLTKLNENRILIAKEMDKNEKFVFTTAIQDSLNASKDINNIARILKKEGFQNSEYFASLIEARVQIQKTFQQYNPEFYKLNIQARTQLVNKEIEDFKKINTPVENKTIWTMRASGEETDKCKLVLNSDIKACNSSYDHCVYLATAQALISGVTSGITLATGYATAIYCEMEKRGCYGHAYEVYNICITPPTPEAE